MQGISRKTFDKHFHFSKQVQCCGNCNHGNFQTVESIEWYCHDPLRCKPVVVNFTSSCSRWVKQKPRREFE